MAGNNMTNISKIINWHELYDPVYLKNILNQLHNMNVQEVQIDNESEFSLIEGQDKYVSVYSSSFILIPNKVSITNKKTLNYIDVEIINLSNYPHILSFIKQHAQFIDDFIQDQNIKTVEISYSENISNYDKEHLHEILNALQNVKNWLHKSNNEELTPLVLAALMKKFYRQEDVETFKFKMSSVLSRIKTNIVFVNSLLNKNIDILKKYSINYNADQCVEIGPTSTEFGFISNKMFKTPYFEMYRQNLDLKFLSYISLETLKEQAEACRI
jgi:hypothetical protein